jgi:putative hydrolase of the HAD superfamily
MGTLVTLVNPVGALRRELARALGVTVGEGAAAAALATEVAYYRAHMHEGTDTDSVAALHERCARELAAALGGAAAAAPPAAMAEVLLAALRFAPHDDAADALRRARVAGARIVVVSNWDVSLVTVLEEIGLAPLLDGVVTSAAIGASKPDPLIFGAALALAGTRPDQAIHVGDSLADDLAGARACGIRPVLLDRSGSATVPADVEVIADLAALAWPPRA